MAWQNQPAQSLPARYAFIQRLLPPMMEAYRAGGVLRFGRFVMQRHGLDDSARELDWTEVDRIQMSVAAIQITKKPANMIWFNLAAATFPNFALLCAVLNTLRDSKV